MRHPLVVAAVAEARETPSPMAATVVLPDGIPGELRRLAGKHARLRLVKVSFDGFEPMELLIPVVVVEGGEVLDVATGEALLRAPMRQRAASPSSLEEEAVVDAIDQTLFTLLSKVDAEEHARFEQAQRQAERFLEDRLLVLRRRRESLAERFAEAKRTRDGAIGSEARSDAEQALAAAAIALEEIDGAIARLERQDDDRFRAFQDQNHERRYTQPRVERLFDLDLVIE
jgi:hypothetical protein